MVSLSTRAVVTWDRSTHWSISKGQFTNLSCNAGNKEKSSGWPTIASHALCLGCRRRCRKPSPLRQLQVLPPVPLPLLKDTEGLAEPGRETPPSRGIRGSLCPLSPLFFPKPRHPSLSRKTVFHPANGSPLASAKQRLQIAFHFLSAKNLLESIKQISVAGEPVPFLFVIVVVFNPGCRPKVCSMSELSCSLLWFSLAWKSKQTAVLCVTLYIRGF